MNRKDLSRREALTLGAGAVGMAAALPTARAEESASGQKQSKADAQYQDKPHASQLCGICAYFIAPSSCRKVEGEIRPTGWCKYFERKS